MVNIGVARIISDGVQRTTILMINSRAAAIAAVAAHPCAAIEDQSNSAQVGTTAVRIASSSTSFRNVQ